MDSSKKAVIRVGQQSIERYSNSLVKRGLDQIRAHSPSPPFPSLKKKVLLIASKDEPIQVIFAEVLYKDGFQVDVLECINEPDLALILQRLANTQYDLIVPTNLGSSPYYIPQLVSEVRKEKQSPAIVVISGHAPLEFVTDLRKRGVDDFFPMPFQYREVDNRISQLLFDGVVESVVDPGLTNSKPTSKSLDRKLIAILDDEQTWVGALDLVLEYHGYRTISYDDKADFLKSLQKDQPDLIISDIQPKEGCIDGFEFVRRIKSDSMYSRIPLIILSGNWSKDEELMELGAFECMRKPFDHNKLLDTVTRAIGKP